jgi:hypothetical protein
VIDSKTGKRVVVSVDNVYGPYIRVSTYSDAGALEDVLDDQYYVLYWKKVPKEFEADGGNEYYFGGAADPEKLQAILDEITFE